MQPRIGGSLAALLALALAWTGGCGGEAAVAPRGAAAGWPTTSGDPGGTRYTPLDEITRDNVRHLAVAWEYRTGDLPGPDSDGRNHSFEATPLLLPEQGALVFCTPRSRVVALDAETGAERWRFDPQLDLALGHYNLNCRGVASWTDAAAPAGSPCRTRIFAASADARLRALDGESGRPCRDFGEGGVVDFSRGLGARGPNEVGVSSPPALVRDVVVVGSAVQESRRADMPSGRVQAFDARSGAPRWSFDPVPGTGAANVWSLISADPERDLVFLPTSSPSPDWYGGLRPGDNRHADSVVAVRGATGEVVWAFQTVHHNLWDYDVASQPVLLDWVEGGRRRPAVAQATKMGHLFFLDRETGEALVPVEERPVPQSDVPGETTSPTQPVPTWPPPLSPQRLTPDDAWGITRWDRDWCRRRIAGLRSEGVFTPPSLQGSVIFPGTAGGSNWGSVAYDPERRLLFANTSSIANLAQIVPREEVDLAEERRRRREANDYLAMAAMEGTPYVARFGVLVSPFEVPCNPPPWGTLTALDLEARELRWRSTLGTTRDLAPLGLALPWGTPNMGGPLATAGGLVFVGAALDDYLRAFDSETGEEVWRGRLPAGGQATPMSYRVRDGGRQFVVIAAGGHSQMRSRRGDRLVAFALPAQAP
jgi:quinoprotein glucose dehydrogenase